MGDGGTETLWSTVLASSGFLRIGSFSRPTLPSSLSCLSFQLLPVGKEISLTFKAFTREVEQ